MTITAPYQMNHNYAAILGVSLHANAKDLQCRLSSSIQLRSRGVKLVNRCIVLQNSEATNLFKIHHNITPKNLQVVINTDAGWQTSHEVIKTKDKLSIKLNWGEHNFMLCLPYIQSERIIYGTDAAVRPTPSNSSASGASDSEQTSDSEGESNKEENEEEEKEEKSDTNLNFEDKLFEHFFCTTQPKFTSTETQKIHETLQWCARVQNLVHSAFDIERLEVSTTAAVPNTHTTNYIAADKAWQKIHNLDQKYEQMAMKMQKHLKPVYATHAFDTLLDTEKCQLVALHPNLYDQLQSDITQAETDFQACLNMASNKFNQNTVHMSLLKTCAGQAEYDKRASVIEKLQAFRILLLHGLTAWHKSKNTTQYTNPFSVRYVRQLYNAMLACDSAIRMNLYAGLGISCSQHVATRHHNLYQAIFSRSLIKHEHEHLTLKPCQIHFLQTTFDNIAACLPVDYAPSSQLYSLDARILCANYMLSNVPGKLDNTKISDYAYATSFDFTYSHRNPSTRKAQKAVCNSVCTYTTAAAPRKHAALWLHRILQMDCEHKILHRNVMQLCMKTINKAVQTNNTNDTDPVVQRVFNLFTSDTQPLAALVLFGKEQPGVFGFMSRMHQPGFALYNHEAKAEMTLDLMCKHCS